MGVPFVGFPFYKYVVGGVKGEIAELEQYLISSFRQVLLSGDMYPRKPISNGITFTFALVMSGMKWKYFSSFLVWTFRILVSSGTVSSKMNSSFVNLSWMTISGRSGLHMHWADIFHCQHFHICILDYCHGAMYIAAG